jgi:hypothetical protein
MSKRNRQPAATTAGGRARSAPIRIDKPKPWGTIALSAVLALVLVGIIGYAVANTGSGVFDPDEDFGDRLARGEDLARDHVAGQVAYEDFPARPPLGGEHNALPQQCGVYDAQIPAEHALHSLEHGAAWITYDPDLPDDQVADLAGRVENSQQRMMSPLPGQESPIVVTAWARQVEAESADDPLVGRFLDRFTNGPLTPERGAACVGNDTTGEVPVDAVPGLEGAVPGLEGAVPGPEGAVPGPEGAVPAPEGEPAPAPEGAPAPAPTS